MVIKQKEMIMTNILRIDSSSRTGAESKSRLLADRVVGQIQNNNPKADIVFRDLAVAPLGHIQNKTIEAYYTPDEQMTEGLKQASAVSDELLSELNQADILVISIPMYNFSVPSAFKAWIDQIVRIGRSFSYENGEFGPLLKDRPTYLCLSYGATGYLDDGPMADYDFMYPYVKFVLGFLGITNVTLFAMQATTAEPEVVAVEQTKIFKAIDQHFKG